MLVLLLILVSIHKVGIIVDAVPGCRNMLIVLLPYWPYIDLNPSNGQEWELEA
jgi:hypothetical protein